MRIGINGYEAVVPRFGYDSNGLPNRVGSSEVCYELLVQLEKIDKKNEYIIYLPSESTSDMPAPRAGWRYEIIPNTKLWTILGLTRALITNRDLDVFFSPTHYGPFFAPCPQVISILDLSYKYFPDLFKKKDLYQLLLWGKYSIKQAKKIITISQSSKSDIIKEYEAKPEKVVVVYPGIKQDKTTKRKMDSLKGKYNIEGDFILFVGTLQPRKNLVRLIEAFKKVSSDYKDLKLVVIGKKGWLFEEIFKAPLESGIENRVVFLDFVPDEDLPEFYRKAKCFVLPSLYEGFGLPILEAMKYGCPVLTSNISSLPEAGGDAALYFDPYRVDDIAEKIKQVLKDKKLRDIMIEKGYEQVKKFSWEESAKQVLEVLEEASKPV